MGPTVCELEGPIPIENRSRAETNAVTFQGYVAGHARMPLRFEESCVHGRLRAIRRQFPRRHASSTPVRTPVALTAQTFGSGPTRASQSAVRSIGAKPNFA